MASSGAIAVKGNLTLSDVKRLKDYIDNKGLLLDDVGERIVVAAEMNDTYLGFPNSSELRKVLKYLQINEINIIYDEKKKVTKINLLDPEDHQFTFEEYMLANRHDRDIIIRIAQNA